MNTYLSLVRFLMNVFVVDLEDSFSARFPYQWIVLPQGVNVGGREEDNAIYIEKKSI